MSISLVSHVALRVVDLREAERYYCDLFGLEVAFREAETPEGWRRLPEGKTWEDAEAAGIHLDMVMLHRDGLALALEEDTPVKANGTLSHIGLLVDEEELRRLRKDLPKFECHLVHDLERTIVFDDRYSVRWEVSQTDYSEPKRLGVRPGRWLEL